MGEWISLATPREPVRGWLAHPLRPARGGIVVLQEIFGVNPHIRTVTDRYAQAGFTALAPALFDVLQPQVELGYDDAGFSRGRELVSELGFDGALGIVSAAARWLREAGHPVGAVGFCWGGSVAFLANTRLGLPAVSYYGARTVPFLGEPLRAPMLFHFGSEDSSIPAQDIDAHRRHQPEAIVHVHAAGHGFNRDVDPAHYDAASARLAHRRTLDFLARTLAPMPHADSGSPPP